MEVCLRQNVENVGVKGHIVKVTDGYALNYLIPQKLAIQVTVKNKAALSMRVKAEEVKSEVLKSKIALLAEDIKTLRIAIKKKCHDDGKLYGALSPEEVVDALKVKDIQINKKQVEFEKSVKTTGEHKVIIKLSAKLKPALTVKITAE
jgi:large subunit ribosomal protein L9